MVGTVIQHQFMGLMVGTIIRHQYMGLLVGTMTNAVLSDAATVHIGTK